MYNLKLISEEGEILNFTHPSYQNDFNCYVLTYNPDFTSNYIDFASSQGQNQRGVSYLGSSVSGKSYSLEGVIMGNAAYLRQKMIDIVLPQRPLAMVFDNKFKTLVYAEKTPNIERKPRDVNFDMVLSAPDPFWYDMDSSRTDIISIQSTFSFPVDYSIPHQFGVKSGELIVPVTNNGNMPAPFAVTFVAIGEVKNPSLIKANDVSKFVKINKTMQIGDRVTVDMRGGMIRVTSVSSGVETEGIGYYNIDSTRFLLDVGDNIFAYSADSGAENFLCFVDHANCYAAPYGDDITYE